MDFATDRDREFEDGKAQFIPKIVSYLIDWCKTWCAKDKSVYGEYLKRFDCADYATYKIRVSSIIDEAFGLRNSLNIMRNEEVDLTKQFCGRHVKRIPKFIWEVQQTNDIVTENTAWPMDLEAFTKCLKASQKALKKAAGANHLLFSEDDDDNTAGAGQTDTAMLHPAVKSKSLPLAE
eukprot:320755_1